MKTKLLMVVIILISVTLYSCSDKEKEQTKVHEMNSQVETETSELVRTGEIDLQSINVNKDDKIYECPMDWNVLSDQHGDCPVCGMELKEYSIAEIQQNLTKYGYEYKK